MVNYDEAYKIAKELKSPIDICTEYEKGFLFGYTGDDGCFGGAGHTPVVILKKNGRAVNMPHFIMHDTGEEIRTFTIEKE